MLQFLFDTDHLTLLDHSDLAVWRHFVQHPPGAVGLSTVSVEEYLRGRLAALARHQNGPLQVQAHARLADSLQLFQQFPVRREPRRLNRTTDSCTRRTNQRLKQASRAYQRHQTTNSQA